MSEASHIKRHAEWFDFILPLGEGHVPVRISREALEDHFGAEAFETLGHAYRHHAEQIHLRVAPLAGQAPAFTADHPLLVQSKDL